MKKPKKAAKKVTPRKAVKKAVKKAVAKKAAVKKAAVKKAAPKKVPPKKKPPVKKLKQVRSTGTGSGRMNVSTTKREPPERAMTGSSGMPVTPHRGDLPKAPEPTVAEDLLEGMREATEAIEANEPVAPKELVHITAAEFPADKLKLLGEKLHDTGINIYREVEALGYKVSDMDALGERLKKEEELFRCEECSTWKGTDLLDPAYLNPTCAECANQIGEDDEEDEEEEDEESSTAGEDLEVELEDEDDGPDGLDQDEGEDDEDDEGPDLDF